MHDLRRQALESGKTVSRKARSKVVSATSSRAGSTVNSPAGSRANSRNPSRAASDEEDNASDSTAWSTHSLDDILDDVDLAPDAWKAELHTRIEQIVDRKRSSTEGRADSLNAFAHILMACFAKDDIEPRTSELVPSILKSIRSETTERETLTALRALTAMAITLDSENIYDSAADELKRIITSSESVPSKVGAIHALSIAAYFGGASEEEAEDIMTFLLEIIESDGLSVDAHDEGAVVTAALEEWGFLATEIDDMEDTTESAMEAFVDQLESADPGVQVAAGENIALLYEKSYTPREEDEAVPEDDSDEENDVPAGERLIKRYDVWRNQKQLLHTLDELASISTRRISKKDRKTLHSSFADIRNSVEHPTRGPKYSTALDKDTGRAYGAGRMRVKINGNVEVRIDKWWKLLRLNALRRALQGGFIHQYDENEAVSRCLPFSMTYRKVDPYSRT
ncbi:IFRD domain-containing protein [Delitschia confertaspora ATCC 74209]|uniref:IFRD domain-containing protein n=1 Tax=Delitschia confertaspora ATCC 74209 TaxID=1513339 RepID=A0A9P4MSV8_9PLEO|nr:IFRD domain-containing protein [Delitschia confertaspora ATCC 74209]